MHEASLELPYADSLYAAIARAKLTYLQRAIDVRRMGMPAARLELSRCRKLPAPASCAAARCAVSMAAMPGSFAGQLRLGMLDARLVNSTALLLPSWTCRLLALPRL